jgi:hypothetical protein
MSPPRTFRDHEQTFKGLAYSADNSQVGADGYYHVPHD